jgi:hypothetical protein
MARKRMYIFERAYVDYKSRLSGFISNVRDICSNTWDWFWKGPGAAGIEVILRIAVVITVIILVVLYYQYEKSHGNDFSLGMLLTILLLILFASVILWGWKAPVHFLARLVSGASASGLILALAVLAILLTAVIFLPYLLILFSLTALSLLVFIPMRAAHWLWLVYRRITYRCPYDDCSYSGLPIHICPSCGHQYNDLKPSFYGIFFHICRHGSQKIKLPTMDFLGRKKLARLCGGCKRPLILSSIGELAEQPIVLVGGPGAGKTVFFRQAVRQLLDRLGTVPGSTVRIDSQAQEKELEDDLNLLDHGQLPEKTSKDVVQAFGLEVRIPKQLRCLLYMFDSPGEHFLTMNRLGRKQVMQHLAGIILLVDPFSLPALSDRTHRIDIEVKPSEIPFQRIVEVLTAGIKMMEFTNPTGQCGIPLAVVLSKTDALPTGDFSFLAGLRHIKGHAVHNPNVDCREAIDKLGGGPSLRVLEQKVTNVRYFASTALGRIPDWRDTRPFQPVGVSEPFLWLLGIDK